MKKKNKKKREEENGHGVVIPIRCMGGFLKQAAV